MRTELTVRAGQVLLAAESVGTGPAIVCLHAGVCDRRMWRPLAAELAPWFRVIAYDRRGFGATPALDEEGSDVQDLIAVLDREVPGAPVILVGASRGGALALDLALAEPGRVSALVLLASAVSGDPDAAYNPDAIQALVEQIEAAERAEDLERLNELEVHAWLDGPEQPDGRVQGELRALLMDMNRIALSQPALLRRVEPPPAYPRLEAVKQPALVVAGDLDFPDRVALSRELATRLPRARSLVVEGTAHLPSLEQPGRVAEAIRAFLAEALDRS